MFQALLTAIRGRLAGPSTRTQAPPLPRPDPPICIIGDLHGRLDLLDRMLADIAAHAAGAPARLIFVGDMIDRGPDSAGVLARLHHAAKDKPEGVICLMGNHERMMLDFLADPLQHGPRWMAAGGVDTLASFGVDPWARHAPDPGKRLSDQADALRKALPADMLSWLEALPLIWQHDTLVVTHAGADPTRPVTDQPDEALLWGHALFHRRARTDDLWIAYGHRIVDRPHAKDGRIAVDTGAWRSGTLSAAWLDQTGLSFLSAS